MNNDCINKIQLTKYLYIYEEVKYSLILSLILKHEFQEVLFWLMEIYESGFKQELWNLTFQIYYDFYCVENPELIHYIKRMYRKWSKDENILHLMKCYKNLYVKKTSPQLFHIQILSNQYSKMDIYERTFKLLRGRKPAICSKFDKKYTLFIRSLYKTHLENIAYFMNSYGEQLFCELLERYILLHNASIYDNTYYTSNANNANNTNNTINNTNTRILLYSYFMMQKHRLNKNVNKREKEYENKDENKHVNKHEKNNYKRNINININKKSIKNQIYIGLSNKDLELYNIFNSNISEPVYKTLQYKMLYAVDNNISQFQLTRDTIPFEQLQELYWYHWDILCYNTPVWNERFRKYNINIQFKDKDKENVINGYYDPSSLYLSYPSNEVFEEFWQKYDYEFDEQPKQVQERTLIKLDFIESSNNIINGKIWYDC